jgi:hypothetical protein
LIQKTQSKHPKTHQKHPKHPKTTKTHKNNTQSSQKALRIMWADSITPNLSLQSQPLTANSLVQAIKILAYTRLTAPNGQKIQFKTVN